MTTAEWTINTGDQQDLHYPGPRSNGKGCLPVWGGDALTYSHPVLKKFHNNGKLGTVFLWVPNP